MRPTEILSHTGVSRGNGDQLAELAVKPEGSKMSQIILATGETTTSYTAPAKENPAELESGWASSWI